MNNSSCTARRSRETLCPCHRPLPLRSWYRYHPCWRSKSRPRYYKEDDPPGEVSRDWWFFWKWTSARCQSPWYNHKFLTVLSEFYWQKRPSLTPKEWNHLTQISHSKPWDISEDIGEKKEKKHLQQVSRYLHTWGEERDGGSCGARKYKQSDKRKRTKIKDVIGKVPRVAATVSDIAWSKNDPREKSRQLSPERDNTNNREKRELKSNIIREKVDSVWRGWRRP